MLSFKVYYDETSQTCNNVVLEVHYQIMWQGQQVIAVQSDVLMGNVSVPEIDQLTAFPVGGNGYKKRRKEIVPSREQFHSLFQYFSATFVNLKKINENQQDFSSEISLKPKKDEILGRKKKSGNPGYNKGMPLISTLYKLEEIKERKKVLSIIVN